MSERVAGRELDAEVAEKVMGWAPAPEGNGYFDVPDGDFRQAGRKGRVSGFCPSTDIAAAFEVVEKMHEWCCDLTVEKAGAAWYVDFRVGHASADTPALAICLAALNAIEGR